MNLPPFFYAGGGFVIFNAQVQKANLKFNDKFINAMLICISISLSRLYKFSDRD